MDGLLINISIKVIVVFILYLVAAGFSLTFLIQYLNGKEEAKYPSPLWKKVFYYIVCLIPVFNILCMLVVFPLVHIFEDAE